MSPCSLWGKRGPPPWGPWGPLRQVMYRRRDAEWDSAPRCDRGGPWGTVGDRGKAGTVGIEWFLMVIFNGDLMGSSGI